jgi:hypothetical protein
MVQQQALRDFTQAMAAFYDPKNPAGRPGLGKDQSEQYLSWFDHRIVVALEEQGPAVVQVGQ